MSMDRYNEKGLLKGYSKSLFPDLTGLSSAHPQAVLIFLSSLLKVGLIPYGRKESLCTLSLY